MGPSRDDINRLSNRISKESEEEQKQKKAADQQRAEQEAAANNSPIDQNENTVENSQPAGETTSTDQSNDVTTAADEVAKDPLDATGNDQPIDSATNSTAPIESEAVTPPSGAAGQNETEEAIDHQDDDTEDSQSQRPVSTNSDDNKSDSEQSTPGAGQGANDPLDGTGSDASNGSGNDQTTSTGNGTVQNSSGDTGQNQPEGATNPQSGDTPQDSQPQPPVAPKSWWDTLFPSTNPGDNKPGDEQPKPEDRERSGSGNDFVDKPCEMPRYHADLLSQELLKSKDGQSISKDDKAMVNSMINNMVYAQNDATVELAQAGLQAFKQAQSAQYPEEHDYYMNKARGYQDTMKKGAPSVSIEDQAKPINISTVDAMIQGYAAAIGGHQNNGSSGLQFTDKAYIERMQKRHDALVTSKEELRTNNLPQREYKMSADTRGYMMANNLNYATFDSMTATSYQHCLAQENLNIVESMATMALNHRNQPGIKEYSNQVSHLAIASQQLNQQSQLENATAITDLNEVFAMYGRAMLDDHLEAAALGVIKDGIVGAAKGASRSLCNWVTFAGNVCTGDEVTLKKIGENLNSLGQNLGAVARELNDSYASLVKMHEPNFSGKNFIDELQAGRIRSQERLDKMANGAAAVLQAGQNAVMNMMQKSVEDNIAGITENIVDTIVIGKIAQGVGILAGSIGNKCIDAGNAINIKIPTNLLDAMPKIVNGQAIAVAGGKTINLGEAIAAGAEGLLDPLLDATTLAAQGNNFYNKAKGSGGGNGSGDKGKSAAEPVKGSSEWKEKYPNGKHRSSAKHNPNSPDYIGKPPRDGQEALNNSFDVEKSKQRVAVQDNKVVILKFEEDGIYHSYIVEDVTTLPLKVRDALVENGFMKDVTSKKLIKK